MAEITNRYIGTDKNQYSVATDYNVLHEYRSYNYVVTLAAITREEYNDPTFFKNNNPLNYVVLKSSGKGSRTIDSAVISDAASDTATQNLSSTIGAFNESGYGRFDFFIDNIEIESLWNLTSGSQPAKIRFDVTEPFSINGFIESVRVNALAAGYENHLDAVFVLKFEFIGYKDGDGLTPPSTVPKATRSFPININGMSLETSERGTVYKVACTSKNGMGLAEDGKLAATAKMKGSNVREVLDNLRAQVEESRKKDQGSEETGPSYNEYKIEFVDGPKIKASTLADSPINDALRSSQVYVFPELSDKNDKNATKTVEKPTKVSYNPSDEVVSFASGVSIMDVITAVIRDSEYTKDLLGSLEEAKQKNNGFIPWFRVTLDTQIKPGKNEKTGALNYIYTYKVRPFMTHYSRLPGQGRGLFDADEIKGQIRRSYNYLYTGKNVDILNFNLKFNYLFIQQRPYQLGNKDQSGTGDAAAASNNTELKEGKTEQDGTSRDQGTTKTIVVTSNSKSEGISGKAPQSTPYFKLGQIMHETLLDTNDLNVIDLQIVGDPYYLVTSNIGNQEETEDEENPGITTTGEATYLGGDVLIDLSFRSPKDIKPDGWADFGEGLLPFSGIYQVTNLINTFREGKFEQKLHALRLPGQLVTETGVKKVGAMLESAKAGETQTKDSAPGSAGSRPSSANLMNMLSRGLPTIGLPGVLANFSNAVGGAIGGVNTALQTTLQRVDDSIAPLNGAIQQAGAALNSLAQVGGLIAAGNALINGFDNPGGAPGLGQNSGGYNPYSSGVRLDTAGLSDMMNGTSQSDQSNVVAQSNVISSFIQDSSNLRTLNSNYYNNVVSERIPLADKNINNVGDKSAEVANSTLVDPKALAYKLGIDPKALSGLSGDQQSSLLSQLMSLASKIPENTDIAGLKSLGMSMSNIYGASIPNLPALQPLTLAPLAKLSTLDLQKIIASGANPASVPGALAVPAIAALYALLNKNKGIPNNGVVGGQQINGQSVLDKIETVQAMGNNLQSNSNFSSAQLGLGSVESNKANLSQTVQGYGGYYVDSKTSFAQFGTQRQDSPVDKLMQTKSSAPLNTVNSTNNRTSGLTK
jgi:hypothetical protein